MKRLLRPEIVIVGTAALALLGWSTVSAATGSRDHQVVLHQVSSETGSTPTPSAEPEAENETPAPVVVEPSPEPAENEPAENENPAPAPATPPPATSSRTFSLVGGTVTFTCTGESISLTSATPAAGFQMETDTEDGGQQIEVKFESDAHKSEIRAACVGGQVEATEVREESD